MQECSSSLSRRAYFSLLGPKERVHRTSPVCISTKEYYEMQLEEYLVYGNLL